MKSTLHHFHPNLKPQLHVVEKFGLAVGGVAVVECRTHVEDVCALSKPGEIRFGDLFLDFGGKGVLDLFGRLFDPDRIGQFV